MISIALVWVKRVEHSVETKIWRINKMLLHVACLCGHIYKNTTQSFLNQRNPIDGLWYSGEVLWKNKWAPGRYIH